MMAEINRVQPRLTVLSVGQIEHIHETALKILAATGVRVDFGARQAALRGRAWGFGRGG